MLVVASAEGAIHGYCLRVTTPDVARDEGSEEKTAPPQHSLAAPLTAATAVLAARVSWEVSAAKGLDVCELSKTHGMLLLCGGWDGTVRLFDVETGQVVTILTQHARHSISSIASFDVSAQQKGQRFWVSGRASRGSAGGYGDGVEVDVFAVGSSDGTISIWAPPVVASKPEGRR
jgi:hypothetical protein